VIETSRKEYNEERHHSTLKNLTPEQFADALLTADSSFGAVLNWGAGQGV